MASARAVISSALIGLATIPAFVRPASADTLLSVTYLRRLVDRPPVLSNLDPVPEDEGAAGALLGQADNATTGRFLGDSYALEVIEVPPGGDLAAAARAAAARGPVLLDMPAADLLAVADLPETAGALLLNVAAEDDALRAGDCRANLLHVAPSLAMRADALMQFLQSRRWTDLALLEGPAPADAAFAAALRSSAAKFGLRLRGELAFDTRGADIRRSAGQELPLLLQDLRDHDVLLVADETDDFARYVPWNTWAATPVAGSDGLMTVSWAPVIEQWGAVQLQERFAALAGRPMRPLDWQGWAAMRALGEAVTRTRSTDPAALRAFLLSPELELAGFKGTSMSFRPWDGQMRQPIALATARAMVAMAPLEGFLHPGSELDTLGVDAPESLCTAFAGDVR